MLLFSRGVDKDIFFKRENNLDYIFLAHIYIYIYISVYTFAVHWQFVLVLPLCKYSGLKHVFVLIFVLSFWQSLKNKSSFDLIIAFFFVYFRKWGLILIVNRVNKTRRLAAFIRQKWLAIFFSFFRKVSNRIIPPGSISKKSRFFMFVLGEGALRKIRKSEKLFNNTGSHDGWKKIYQNRLKCR